MDQYKKSATCSLTPFLRPSFVRPSGLPNRKFFFNFSVKKLLYAKIWTYVVFFKELVWMNYYSSVNWNWWMYTYYVQLKITPFVASVRVLLLR